MKLLGKAALWFAMAAILGGCAKAAREDGARSAGESPGASGGAVAARQEIRVDESGFHPTTVNAHVGSPITLVLTRTSDKTCATEIVIPSLHQRHDLPLNQTVEVTVTPKKTSDIQFACGMDMYKGVIHVE